MQGNARSAATPSPQAPSVGEARTGSAGGRFWLILAVLCAIALLLRLAILDEFLHKNPLSELPCADGAIYWQMAGRMAAGQWIDTQPFLSAPLYPYFLGVIRTLGGDLHTVYVVQLLLHLATAVLIGWVTRLRFGSVAGLVAAALFLALTEPAVTCTRILANTLQIALVALLWWRWVVLIDHGRRWRDVLAVGALLGLLALAFPGALLLVPLFVLWGWWSWGRGWSAVIRALIGGAVALVIIAPATLHNFLIYGQFIPISAHAGITLRQGNGPGACGVCADVPGISPARQQMHGDAAARFRAIYGRPGTWTEIDAHFRREAIQYWLSNPGAALQLVAMKLYLFCTAQNYDEMMPTVLERQYGIARRSVLVPLPVPWILGAAFIGVAVMLQRPVQRLPEWALTLLPLVLVLIFFYSPRYRLVGVPLYCGLAAYAVTHCTKFRRPPAVTIAAMLLLPALTLFNAAFGSAGVDSPDTIRPQWARAMSAQYVLAGNRRLAAEKPDEAVQRYRTALDLNEQSAEAHRRLGDLYLQRGDSAAGERELGRALELNPRDRLSLAALYTYYCAKESYRSAAGAVRRSVAADPNNTEARLALAWLLATCSDARVRDGAAALENARLARHALGPRPDVLDVLAAAQAEAQQHDEAIQTATSALDVASRENRSDLAQEIARRLEQYRQRQPCRAAPRPLSVPAAE